LRADSEHQTENVVWRASSNQTPGRVEAHCLVISI
jgi:hypothetical protein